jgi:hypothetical protein
MALDDDRTILQEGLEEALRIDRERKPRRTLISSPDSSVIQTLSDAIGKCEAYKFVAGHMAYTGGSGPVLTADLLATYLFNKADSPVDGGIPAAIEWLLKVLGTREADGIFIVAVWGLSIDKEMTLLDSSRLMPFSNLPNSYMKSRISERAKRLYDGSVWLAHNYFDEPCVAHVNNIRSFPYIGAGGASFEKIAKLQHAARDFWLFLEAASVGHTLAIGCWFEYDDQSLDFNQWQNSITWILPEIHPRILKSTPVNSGDIQTRLQSFEALPAKVRDRLLRSMGRFELSQCRNATIDRILELTLAFEIAVSGPGSEGAISWKVSVRSAQLIGGPITRRQLIRDNVNRLYRLRSKATHGSDLSAHDRTELEETLSSCLSIYRELILSFLVLGEDPKWDSLELQARIPD